MTLTEQVQNLVIAFRERASQLPPHEREVALQQMTDLLKRLNEDMHITLMQLQSATSAEDVIHLAHKVHTPDVDHVSEYI